MKITQSKIDDLKPADYNPRKWSDEAKKQVVESIKKFGFVQPIVVNSAPKREGIVIGGNLRLAMAKEMGFDKVPVYYVDIPNLKKEKELNLRLNKNQAEFDFGLLSEFEEELLRVVGFTEQELDKIFDDTSDDDDFDAKKVAESIKEPTSKIGDIYELGEHRLMCGDATNGVHVMELMNESKADMVFTDPPYNVNYSGRGKKTSNTIKNDHMSEEQFRQFLVSTFKNYVAIMNDRAGLYTCYASRTHREFEDALNEAGLEVINQVIWVKKVASMGWGDYRWKHEPILYCRLAGQAVEFYGDRKQYTEWTEELTDKELLRKVKRMIDREEKGGSTVWRLHRDSKYDHPTQKPLQLCKIAIVNSSIRRQLVVDLFGGSGSTLIAADMVNRRCYTMEIDPVYCDVILNRWEQYSGKKAKKVDEFL